MQPLPRHGVSRGLESGKILLPRIPLRCMRATCCFLLPPRRGKDGMGVEYERMYSVFTLPLAPSRRGGGEKMRWGEGTMMKFSRVGGLALARRIRPTCTTMELYSVIGWRCVAPEFREILFSRIALRCMRATCCFLLPPRRGKENLVPLQAKAL